MLALTLLLVPLHFITAAVAAPAPIAIDAATCPKGFACDSHKARDIDNYAKRDLDGYCSVGTYPCYGLCIPREIVCGTIYTRDVDASAKPAMTAAELKAARKAGKITVHKDYWCDLETEFCYPNPLDYGNEPPAHII